MPYRCTNGVPDKDAATGDWYCYIDVSGKKVKTGRAEYYVPSDEEKDQGSSVTGQVQSDEQPPEADIEQLSGVAGILNFIANSTGEKKGYKQEKSEFETPEGTVTRYEKTYDGEDKPIVTETLTKTDPVIKQKGGYYDRLDRLGGGEGPDIMTSEYEAQAYPMDVMGTTGARGNPAYDNFQKGLEGYFGQEFMSYTTDQSAWNQMIKIAQRNNVSPWDLLKQGQKDWKPSKKGGGGGGGGGTRYSYTEMNEADVRVLANEMSEAFIGRRVTDKEFKQLLKKVRKEEGKSPTITTSSGSTTRTKQGITNAEREEVMAEILNENPEYREYQMGAGALEYTRKYLAEQKQKAAL